MCPPARCLQTAHARPGDKPGVVRHADLLMLLPVLQGAGLQDMTEIQMRLSIMTGLHVKLQDQCAAFGRMRAK